MEDGINQIGDQTYDGDNGFIGYGAVYGNRNPQIRADFGPGLYAALITPKRGDEPFNGLNSLNGTANLNGSVDYLMPKINFGWNVDAGKVQLKPSLMIQMFSTNGDLATINSYKLVDGAEVDGYYFVYAAEYDTVGEKKYTKLQQTKKSDTKR
jgi:hypothetical protein